MVTGNDNGPRPVGRRERPVGLRILVVEDDADSAEILATLLRLEGHQVRVARDGFRALEVIAGSPPDVVLLDIGLPGMDGWQVARRVRGLALRRRPLLIAVTGYGREADRRRSQEAGIDLHLLKPVDPDWLQELLEAIHQRLAPAGRSPAGAAAVEELVAAAL